jgi:hypothetical protein
MTNQIDHIVQHLFNKKRLDDVSVYELERFIATHPYFAAGHFLLAKKSQSESFDNFKEKVATTALYYHNPLWLQWLLDQDDNDASKNNELAEPIHQGFDATQMAETADRIFSEDQKDVEMAGQPTGSATSEDINQSYSSQAQEENTLVTSGDSNHQERVDAFQDVTITDTSTVQPGKDVGPQSDFKEPDITPASEGIKETEGIQRPGLDQLEESETVGKPGQPELIGNTNQPGTPEFEDEAHGADQEQGPGNNDQEDEESRASAASIEKTLSGAALIPTKADIDKDDLAFEPYHTIDYFASQGIRLQQADLSKDKFGKQLKSFTEWLRSMKRLPNAAVDGSLDEATQRSIQQIAEHSFEEKDIVTETMAEVWIKQGNKEKAIDTLHKLSLQNPSKSHYFAAKIEQLKAS